MRVLAPAKINLHLRVAPVNPDGFHPLQSWMCTVGLFDKLSFEESKTVPPSLAMRCDDPALACDENNLVIRAARMMGESNVSILLEKRIPTGGGLGGGSSDAARTLLALNKLRQHGRSEEALAVIAAMIGSDVAFFCNGPSSICTGRGEIVRPTKPPTPPWVLLILPSLSVPTGPVYRRFDELLGDDDRVNLKAAVAHEPPYEQWADLPSPSLLPLLVNDLERPAFDLYPQLARCRVELEQFLGRVVRMSGSGSSLFTLYDEQANAERAAATLDGSTRPDGISLKVMAVPLAPSIDDDLA